MRIDERLSWNAITDEHRTTTAKLGFTDVREFLAYELGNFLTGYNRCRAQKQEKYIEIWIEKAALLHIVQPVADEFCRRVVCCKGYNSITFQSKFYDRATEAIRMGQEPIVLYFGDWDPSGENMILAAMQTLTEELDLYGVTYHRCGINHEHFDMISADPVPLKPDDSRTKKFVEKYGKTAYELDAFHPLQLQDLVRESIRGFTDMGVYAENAEQEYDDDDTIDEFKEEVLAYIYDKLEDYGL
jgi:hypothetical protein